MADIEAAALSMVFVCCRLITGATRVFGRCSFDHFVYTYCGAASGWGSLKAPASEQRGRYHGEVEGISPCKDTSFTSYTPLQHVIIGLDLI